MARGRHGRDRGRRDRARSATGCRHPARRCIGVSDAARSPGARPTRRAATCCGRGRSAGSPGRPQLLARAPRGGELGRPAVARRAGALPRRGSRRQPHRARRPGHGRPADPPPHAGRPGQRTRRRTARGSCTSTPRAGSRSCGSGRSTPGGADDVIAVHPSSGRRDREHEPGRTAAPAPPSRAAAADRPARARRSRCGAPRSRPTAPTSRASSPAPARRGVRTSCAWRCPSGGRRGVSSANVRRGTHTCPGARSSHCSSPRSSLAAPVGAQAKHRPYQHVPEPGGRGRGRRRRHRRLRGHGRRDSRRCKRRRQRRRRDRRRRRGARRDRAVLVRRGRRRLHGHPHAERQGDDDRRPRGGARGDDVRPRSSIRRRASRSRSPRRATAGSRPACRAPWRRGTRRSKRYGTWSLKRALQRGIDVAERGFVIDQTFYEQANDNVA